MTKLKAKKAFDEAIAAASAEEAISSPVEGEEKEGKRR